MHKRYLLGIGKATKTSKTKSAPPQIEINIFSTGRRPVRLTGTRRQILRKHGDMTLREILAAAA